MGYFPVRYDSRVIIYERKMFIRLATGTESTKIIFSNLPRPEFLSISRSRYTRPKSHESIFKASATSLCLYFSELNAIFYLSTGKNGRSRLILKVAGLEFKPGPQPTKIIFSAGLKDL